jgi:hypothetical protein
VVDESATDSAQLWSDAFSRRNRPPRVPPLREGWGVRLTACEGGEFFVGEVGEFLAGGDFWNGGAQVGLCRPAEATVGEPGCGRGGSGRRTRSRSRCGRGWGGRLEACEGCEFGVAISSSGGVGSTFRAASPLLRGVYRVIVL